MSFKEMIKLRFVPPLASRLIRWTGNSLRLDIRGREHVEEIHRRGGRVIYVFWHGSQFLPAWAFSGEPITILSSPSVDGRMQADILQRLGYNIITGSSSRGAVGALKGLIRELDDGRDVALAVDGPRGPYHKAKPGLHLLARRTGAWVVPLAGEVDRYFESGRSWDRYRLPKPLARGVFLIGKPFRADDFLHPEMLHMYVDKCLDLLHEEAETALKGMSAS